LPAQSLSFCFAAMCEKSMRLRPKKDMRKLPETIYTRESQSYDQRTITTDTDDLNFRRFVDPV
jgi:hypothetical protein